MSITDDVIQVVNDMVKQKVTPDGIQFYNINHQSILSDLFTNGDLYDNNSYASYVDWKIGNELEIDLKKILFDTNVKDDVIADLNDEGAIHLKDDLSNDNNTTIEDSEVQHKQDDRNNIFVLLLKTNYNQAIS